MQRVTTTIGQLGRAIAPILLTSSLAAAPVAADAPKQSAVTATAAQKGMVGLKGELTEILSQREISALVAGYAPVFSELQSAVARLDSVTSREASGEKVDWKGIVDNYSSPTGEAANRIIGFQLTYDGTSALQLVGKMSGDPKWYSLAESVARIYTTSYAVPSDGKVPAFKNYSTGLIALGERTGKTEFIRAALLQETNAPYIRPDAISKEELKSPFLSRENALATIAMVNANHAAKQLDRSLFQFHVQCLDQHLKLWEQALLNPGTELPGWPKTVNAEYQGLSPSDHIEVQQTYVRPFMVALTVIATVRALEVNREELTPVLQQAGKTLHALKVLYKPGAKSFPYTDRKFPVDHALTKLSDGLTDEPTPDLNGLIGGAYYRAGIALGDEDLKSFGASLIKNGLSSMYTGGKQLNQFLLPYADTLLR